MGKLKRKKVETMQEVGEATRKVAWISLIYLEDPDPAPLLKANNPTHSTKMPMERMRSAIMIPYTNLRTYFFSNSNSLSSNNQ